MAYAGVNKTLLVASAWVGDMVMAHTLVRLLAEQDPNAQLHVLAPPATAPIARRMREVTQTLVLDIAHGELGLAKRWRTAQDLRAHAYTTAYVLPNTWKSALIPWLAKIPTRVGWHGEARFGLLNRRRRLDTDRYPLMIQRYMALANPKGDLPDPYPLPRLRADAENARALVNRLDLLTGLDEANVIGLCPGAEFGPAKKWPGEYYAQLADGLIEQGHQVWLFGSPRDVPDCERIAGLCPGVKNLAGHTRLEDAIDLLSLCQQVVSNDSGLMHIACALDVPTVGLFGSTSPRFTPPLGDGARVVEIDEPCRPCFARECPLGHLNCLRKITPEQVLSRVVP